MSERDPKDQKVDETEILRNEYGTGPDPTVVVDEADRTVLLTDNETIVIEKVEPISIAPKNRPRKVYSGMWGPLELGMLGAGMLAILAVIVIYVFFVAPSNRELENNSARLDRLDKEYVSAKEKYGNFANVETEVARLISSVNDFEARYLPVSSTGRTAIYQRVNGLILSHGLFPSNGPDFGPLEILDRSQQEGGDDRGGRSKFRSFFPGVYVTTTVEGPYVNLRRFLRDIETGSEFIVVSSVELEPSDSSGWSDESAPTTAGSSGFPPGMDPTTAYPTGVNSAMPNQSQASLPSSAKGKMHGSVVRLKIEMAAYFRRPNSVPVDVDPTVQ
ncbi:MAG TPA: hypothetical protein PKD26_03870 [Pyrinomonadaceae bacterium]|nr:hypothetical protein [Pyrinomonadaceae bacterium]